MVTTSKSPVVGDRFSVAEHFSVLSCAAAQIYVLAAQSSSELSLEIKSAATVVARNLHALRAQVLTTDNGQPATLANSWPRPIPVTERMPAQPDADCMDEYLCLFSAPAGPMRPSGWEKAEWDGVYFWYCDVGFAAGAEVTHWMPLPPDPPFGEERRAKSAGCAPEAQL